MKIKWSFVTNTFLDDDGNVIKRMLFGYKKTTGTTVCMVICPIIATICQRFFPDVNLSHAKQNIILTVNKVYLWCYVIETWQMTNYLQRHSNHCRMNYSLYALILHCCIICLHFYNTLYTKSMVMIVIWYALVLTSNCAPVVKRLRFGAQV